MRAELECVVTFAKSRSRASDRAVQRFVAYGQLCHLLVTAQIDSVPGDWARLLNEGIRHPAGRPNGDQDSTKGPSRNGGRDPSGVELRGIEPRSGSAFPGLLRAQSARRFLGPRARTDTSRTGPVTLSPRSPGDKDCEQWLSR